MKQFFPFKEKGCFLFYWMLISPILTYERSISMMRKSIPRTWSPFPDRETHSWTKKPIFLLRSPFPNGETHFPHEKPIPKLHSPFITKATGTPVAILILYKRFPWRFRYSIGNRRGRVEDWPLGACLFVILRYCFRRGGRIFHFRGRCG